jgi:hypothetical protein
VVSKCLVIVLAKTKFVRGDTSGDQAQPNQKDSTPQYSRRLLHCESLNLGYDCS